MRPLGNTIKKWLGREKKNSAAGAAENHQEGSGVEEDSTTDRRRTDGGEVEAEAERAYLRNEVTVAGRGFVPQARGTEATLAWLKRRTPDALSRLLIERDQAERQNRRGPKTRGTRQVKQILLRPCRTTVEQLHQVRDQAEAAVRYGGDVPGAVAYSLGRSFQNRAVRGSPRLPSLQLHDFGTMVGEQLELVSRITGGALSSVSDPRTWFDTRSPKPSGSPSPSPEPVGEASAGGEASTEGSGPGASGPGFRYSDNASRYELERDKRAESLSLVTDVAVEHDEDPYDNSPETPQARTAEEEWEAREATFVPIAQVPTAGVRKVHIKRRGRGEWRPMPKLSEVSTPKDTGADE
ncbi:hypothetical protein DL766_009080 [Monosporascus sp. MC13-8B]|uniref:Uncharacterized protein n=1 Tax=Monosporascus cannonballus TaxID=155416 RepID=A0ABY0HAM1_9PEZI|nr:hypothetical protein DL763_009100 [Monosporascus cannonballus]RYO86991.1 hypothetical protein DL762_004416 [Monosporascus cannonballus]RYP16651.1 hypothetical protein DL766_009080 [Monosporascus sp. MC13-8B]